MSRVGGRLGDELELRALGRAIWYRRWRILAPAVILSVLALIAVNTITPLYRSEARILIEGRDNIYLRPEADKTAAAPAKATELLLAHLKKHPV